MEPEKFAINLAKKSGKIISGNFTLGMKKEWKDDESLVTATDKEINWLVESEVRKHFPNFGLLAEEGSFDEKNKLLWVCDPVDGTIPFAHGCPNCVFSLALVRDGEPQLGVIFDPFLNRLFFASSGQGAFLNGQPIHVSSQTEMKNNAVGITIWRNARYDLRQFNSLLVDSSAFIISSGSTAYMGMLVAGGEFAANVWPGKTPWDIAALKVIVKEAGGKVTDFFGHDQRYDTEIRGSVASNGRIHDELIEMIKKSGIKSE